MPCTVIFEGGDKRTSLTLEPDAKEVGERLAQAPTGFLCFEQRGGKDVWINAASVLYVEPRGKNDTGFS
ncbi:MAG TPA: hypothetical protein VGH26_08065 [Gaiellaceae bacterium]|jgi:hypothetical protein